MGGADLHLNLLRLSALGLVNGPGLVQVVTVVVSLGQEFHRLFNKR